MTALKVLTLTFVVAAVVGALIILGPRLSSMTSSKTGSEASNAGNTNHETAPGADTGVPSGTGSGPGTGAEVGADSGTGTAPGAGFGTNADTNAQTFGHEDTALPDAGTGGASPDHHPEGAGHSGAVKGGALTKTGARGQKQGTQKDPNQTDLDWISQIPNPNISVNVTVKSVDRYHKALIAFTEGTQTRSIDIVFQMGQRAARDVVYSSGKMDPDEYASVEPQMQGFIFDRRGIFEVYPDYEYFEKLASSRGSAADQDFFATGRELTNKGISKFYNQVSEVSTCTNYGPGLVVNAYQKWSDYKHRYPDAYVAEVEKKIGEAVNELTTNSCLCGSEKTLYEEYAQFFKLFPNAELTKTLRARMKDIKSGAVKVDPDCKSAMSDGKFR